MFQVRLTVPVVRKSGGRETGQFISRFADLPIPPFIGLSIGALTVVEVLVLQGDSDSGIELRMSPVEMQFADAWVSHTKGKPGGWCWLD